jgi:hypothetical protein
MNNFYQPLTGADDMRVLELFPGQFNDDIRCDLRTVSIQQAPKYGAVSYVWGNLDDKRMISVNGFGFAITQNLELALRHFRDGTNSRTLWVDAICINQKDDGERNQQVSIMGDIYERCDPVLIWLGVPLREPLGQQNSFMQRLRGAIRASTSKQVSKDGPATKSATGTGSTDGVTYWPTSVVDIQTPFILVKHFANDGHIFDLPGYREVFTLRGRKRVFSATEPFLLLWRDLCSGLQSDWWTRLWCVQEASLPSRAIVYFGQFTISWSDLRVSAVNYRKHFFGCCQQVRELASPEYFVVPDMMLLPHRTRSTDWSSLNLDLLLRVYRYKECQDARDKVFGLLGLAKRIGNQCNIVADYSDSIGTVYSTTMQEICRQNPTDLSFLTGRGFHSPENDLPSWVRDFSQRPTNKDVSLEMDRLNTYFLYNASANLINKDQPHEIKVCGTQKLFGVNGVCISKVTKLGAHKVETKDWTEIGSVVEDWYRVANIHPTPKKQISKFPLHANFWRTMIGDVVFEGRSRLDDQLSSSGDGDEIFRRFSNERDTSQFDLWLYNLLRAWKWRRLPFAGGVMNLIQMIEEASFIESFVCAIHNRRFFLAELNGIGKVEGCRQLDNRDKGYDTVRYGLCDPDTQTGDQIWILAGGRVPFILRPVLSPSSERACEKSSSSVTDKANNYGSGSPTYTLIGDCYLHGAMDGKLVSSESEVRRIWLA